jgi:hypothetical protein
MAGGISGGPLSALAVSCASRSAIAASTLVISRSNCSALSIRSPAALAAIFVPSTACSAQSTNPAWTAVCTLR